MRVIVIRLLVVITCMLFFTVSVLSLGETEEFWEEGLTDEHIDENDGTGPTWTRSFCGGTPEDSGCSLYQNTEGYAGYQDRNRMIATWNTELDLTGIENLTFRRQILQHDRHAFMGVLIDHDGDAEDAWNNRGSGSAYYEDPEDYTSGNTWDEQPSSDETSGDSGEWQDGRVRVNVSDYTGETGVTLYSGHSMYWYETADSEFWAYDLQFEGQTDKLICDHRGLSDECISNSTHEISGQEFNISNIFESRSNAVFEAFNGPATLSLENTTRISGLWRGQISIESEQPRLEAGASFRPENERIVIGN